MEKVTLSPVQEAMVGAGVGVFLGVLLMLVGGVSPQAIIGTTIGCSVGAYVNALWRGRQQRRAAQHPDVKDTLR